MQILSLSECTPWLELRSMPESPYSYPSVGTTYARLTPPKTAAGAASISAAMCSSSNPSEMMLQVVDWSRYEISNEMPQALQSAEIASSNTFDRIGIVFDAAETILACECCSYVVSMGMSAYAFFPAAQFSAYLWEGDFVELWSQSSITVETVVRGLIKAGAKTVTQ